MTSDDWDQKPEVLRKSEGATQHGYTTRYGDALRRAGQAADPYARRNIFTDYHKKKALGTQKAQKADLKIFSRFLAQMQIHLPAEDLYSDAEAWDGMSASLLLSFRQWLLYGQPKEDGQTKARGYSTGSVRRRMSTVRQYCKLAFQSGTITGEQWTLIEAAKADSHAESANVDAGREEMNIVPRMNGRKERATPLSEQEFTTLRRTTTTHKHYREHDAILSERDALLVCLLGEHGMRVGEVVALNRNGITLRTNEITVTHTKTHGDEDVLKLLPATRRAAELYLPLLGELRSVPLFEGYKGKRITRQGVYERVKNLGRTIGVPNLSPHDLRHFFAKNAFLHGNPLNLIQHYGGWKSGHMPLRYAKQYGPNVGILKVGTEKE